MNKFVTENSEFIDSKKEISNGYQITYDPVKNKTTSIKVDEDYLNSDELNKLTDLSKEFKLLIDKHSSNISFAVGYIVLNDDKPIKIKRIIE